MKKITILTLSFLILIGAYLVISKDNSSTISSPESAFAVQDTSKVTQIFLTDKENHSVLLKRDEQGRWIINNKYPANQDVMNMFLETLTDLKVQAPVSEARQESVFSSMAARSVKIEIYQNTYKLQLTENLKFWKEEAKTKVYYVGGSTPNNRGSYMLMEGAKKPYITHILGLNGYVSTLYTALVDKWRSHTIFNTKFQNIASVSVDFPSNKEESFKIINKEGEYEIMALQNKQIVQGYDTLKMYNFVTAFADLRFESFKNTLSIKDSIINSIPFHIITLTDDEGEIFQVKTFKANNLKNKLDVTGDPYTYDVDRMYALVNEDKDFVLIQYFVFDRIIQPLSYYKK
jgi:hypothetical protein